jgi:hypothetical protein
MNFKKHVHAEIEGRIFERWRRRIIDRRHDDEDAVGAPCAASATWYGSYMKSLRSAGNAPPRARQAVFGAALERGRVCEHRQTRRAARLIGARELGGRDASRIVPFDGLAFLISAINAYPPALSRRSIAARNPRGAGAALAAKVISANGRSRLAAAISSRL